MLHINIILVGKLKENYWLEAEKEYLKRLQAFAAVNIFEIREESFSEKDPVGLVKEKEGKKIIEALEKIKDKFVIVLEEKGKEFSSPNFAGQINKWGEINNNLVFVIGGPLGISEEVRKKANTVLSLSQLTFTHQMTRVILLEQIYRAFMINGGRKYHY